MAWWAPEKITTDTSALRGRCTFNQLFTPPLTTSHAPTCMHAYTQFLQGPLTKNVGCNWIKIRNRAHAWNRPAMTGSGKGTTWCYLTDCIIWLPLFNITGQLKNSDVTSCRSVCLLEPSSSPFFTYFMSFPLLLSQQLHHVVFFFFFQAPFITSWFTLCHFTRKQTHTHTLK